MGTPRIMPAKPNRPPPKRIEKMTQKEDKPVLSPKMAGPMILPSIC